MARRRFFVDAVERGQARITGAEAHHLTRVLRVEPGQQFEISDNHAVYLAEVESARKDLVSFSVRERIAFAGPAVRIILLAALIRFERFEWMLEKATELGVERVVPVIAGRSERGLDRAAGKRMTRWNRIAREASEQSRRAHLPEIGVPIDFENALNIAAGYRYVLEEAEAPPILAEMPAQPQRGELLALLVGPEGGWTDRERQQLGRSEWRAVSLGSQILRAETAAIVDAAWNQKP